MILSDAFNFIRVLCRGLIRSLAMLVHLGVRVLPLLLRLVELKQVKGCHFTPNQSAVLLDSKVCECAHGAKEEDVV